MPVLGIILWKEILQSLIRYSPLAKCPSTLSWLTEILELKKGNYLSCTEGGFERHLLYFVIPRGNWYSIMILLLSNVSFLSLIIVLRYNFDVSKMPLFFTQITDHNNLKWIINRIDQCCTQGPANLFNPGFQIRQIMNISFLVLLPNYCKILTKNTISYF